MKEEGRLDTPERGGQSFARLTQLASRTHGAEMDIDVDLWRRRIREDTLSRYHYEMGRALERSGTLPEAAEAYRRAIAICADYPAACQRLIGLLTATGHTDLAQAQEARIRAINPDYIAWAWHRFAVEALEEGRCRDALTALDTALSCCPTLPVDPDLAKVCFTLATEAEQDGRYEEAHTLLHRGLKLAPDNGGLWRLLGFMHLFQCRIDSAGHAFANALAFSPSEAMAYNGMGLVLQAQGNLDAALRHHLHAVDLTPQSVPRNKAESLCSTVVTYCARNELVEAARAIEHACTIDPQNPNVWIHRGVVALLTGKLDSAEDYLREALRLLPDYGFAETNLALVLEAKGLETDALEMHRRSIVHMSSSQRRFLTLFRPWASKALQQVYRKLGLSDER